jgi:hypothetical protein
MSSEPTSALPFSGVIPPELAADTRAVLDKLTAGKPLDEETRDRLRREAAKVRDAIRHEHGILDVGVAAVRELRDA